MTWNDLEFHLANMPKERKNDKVIFVDEFGSGGDWEIDALDQVPVEDLLTDPFNYELTRNDITGEDLPKTVYVLIP